MLAERGHQVEFATLDGQEHWTKDYPFIAETHLLGPGPTIEQTDAHYLRCRDWDMSKGLAKVMDSKYMFDSFWPQTYRGLKEIIDNPETRPDFVIADVFVDAVKDLHVEYNEFPIAIVAPTMPALMMPCSYIPGEPGFQIEGTTTSEHASIRLRLLNELIVPRNLGTILKWMLWTKKMRRQNGVYHPPHSPKKPDFLYFVNSFFGLENPRDLPPTCAMIGPLLSPDYPPLDEHCDVFLKKHEKVIYIALGTHVILRDNEVEKIMHGLLRLLQDRLVDGVIWAIGESARQEIQTDKVYNLGAKDTMKMGDLMAGRHSNFIFPYFVPQRAVLDDERVKLYFTHGGGSSANEAAFHGKAMLSMGIYSDQVENTARLVESGVAESLHKVQMTSDELYAKARMILEDSKQYQRQVLRMMRIARINSRQKYHAADLIEQELYDHELRFDDNGKQLRPMNLQTADMRMPLYKARNWDLMAVFVLGVVGVAGSLAFSGLTLRSIYLHMAG